MNSVEFSNHFHSVVERSEKVLLAKRQEYATDGSVFRNFDEGIGLSFHTSNVGVAWEYMVKHLQSLKDIISDIELNKFENLTESLINEKMGDIINYMILIEGMLKERLEIEKNLPF